MTRPNRAVAADIATAAALLDRLNVSVDDLLHENRCRVETPTFAAYVPVV